MKKIGEFLRNVGQHISEGYFKGLQYVIRFVAFVIGHVWLFLLKIWSYPPLSYINKGLKAVKNVAKKPFGRTTMAQKKAITGYMFMMPWIIGFLTLVVYPFGRIIYMSLNNVSLYQQNYVYDYIGLRNFERILTEDIDFIIEVQNFVARVLLYTPVIITLAIIIAMLLNQNVKGKGLFRMIFFLPIIILNGELLQNMSDYGGMDINLSFFVIDIITTVVPHFAVNLFVEMFSYIVEILWYTGVPILIFLAMLQKIDRSLYEAASIDGANAWSIFWKITLPIIRPAITVSIIFIVVFLANFDGNPINNIILVSKNDGARRDGYASAMALIYSFVQIVVITILYFIARERPQKGRL